MSAYVFYAKGKIGWGYTFEEGFSVASFSAGIVDLTFHTPKLVSSLPDEHWANPNFYFGLGLWNVDLSIGRGFSATVEVYSGTIGIQIGEIIKY